MGWFVVQNRRHSGSRYIYLSVCPLSPRSSFPSHQGRLQLIDARHSKPELRIGPGRTVGDGRVRGLRWERQEKNKDPLKIKNLLMLFFACFLLEMFSDVFLQCRSRHSENLFCLIMCLNMEVFICHQFLISLDLVHLMALQGYCKVLKNNSDFILAADAGRYPHTCS